MTEKTITERTDSFIDACDSAADRVHAFAMLKAHARHLAAGWAEEKQERLATLVLAAKDRDALSEERARAERRYKDAAEYVERAVVAESKLREIGEYAEAIAGAARQLLDGASEVQDNGLRYVCPSDLERLRRAVKTENEIRQQDEPGHAIDTRFDKGPWSVTESLQVASDDFTHDVMLRISGDFPDQERKRAYAEGLAAALNRGHSQCPQVSEEGGP